MENRDLVIFIDASISVQQISLIPIQAAPCFEISSHALSPASLLNLYQSTFQKNPPKALLLEIGAFEFELGQDISEPCLSNMNHASLLLMGFLSDLFG